ncbi:MAG: prepilin-type N-terminal cleavage/methylation domain-containing protein [bacterium]
MRGFTLIEILIVVAITAVLIKIALPSLDLLTSQTGATDAAVVYAQALRRAEALAVAGRNDSPWGVKIATSSILLFKGATYASRDIVYDDQYAASIVFIVSGVTEVDFAKFTGLPNTQGTATITDILGTVTKTVTINAKGTVTY